MPPPPSGDVRVPLYGRHHLFSELARGTHTHKKDSRASTLKSGLVMYHLLAVCLQQQFLGCAAACGSLPPSPRVGNPAAMQSVAWGEPLGSSSSLPPPRLRHTPQLRRQPNSINRIPTPACVWVVSGGRETEAEIPSPFAVVFVKNGSSINWCELWSPDPQLAHTS